MGRPNNAEAFMGNHTPEETLRAFRGQGMICGCGRVLIPVMRDGKRAGVTHSIEDGDFHSRFFGGSLYDDEDDGGPTEPITQQEEQ